MNLEFCSPSGEQAEKHRAWRQGDDSVGEKLADAAVYLLGLAETPNVDLGAEVEHKMTKNEKRVYAEVNDVMRRIREADEKRQMSPGAYE